VRAEGVQRCAESQGHDELGSQLPPEQRGDLTGLFGELGEVVPGGGELGPQLGGDLLAPSGTAAGVGVDSQYAVFGAFGAITFMALSGVLLDRLRAATPSARHVPPTATA
jgi:hypothetical protein